MAYSIALHIIGLVFWLGGLAVITRFMQIFTVAPAPQAAAVFDYFRTLTVKIWRGVIAGLAVSTATGLYQFFNAGAAYYMKQGWFHGKLTLLVVLFAVTHMVGREVRKAAAGETLIKKRLMVLHAVSATILVLIVFLTIVGRAG